MRILLKGTLYNIYSQENDPIGNAHHPAQTHKSSKLCESTRGADLRKHTDATFCLQPQPKQISLSGNAENPTEETHFIVDVHGTSVWTWQAIAIQHALNHLRMVTMATRTPCSQRLLVLIIPTDVSCRCFAHEYGIHDRKPAARWRLNTEQLGHTLQERDTRVFTMLGFPQIKSQRTRAHTSAAQPCNWVREFATSTHSRLRSRWTKHTSCKGPSPNYSLPRAREGEIFLLNQDLGTKTPEEAHTGAVIADVTFTSRTGHLTYEFIHPRYGVAAPVNIS